MDMSVRNRPGKGSGAARRLVLAGILLLPGAVAVAESLLYVQSLQARLLAEPRADAAVVTTLERGAAVRVLESNASWHKVHSPGGEGWLFRYLLTDHPPLAPATLALNEDVDREHARRRASAVITAGATRGLTPQERERAHQQGLADYAALAKVDGLAIDAAQVQDFVQTGIPQ